RRLRTQSGLDPSDKLLVLQRGRIAAGPSDLVGARLAAPDRARTVSVGGSRYRVLTTTSQEGAESNPALGLVAYAVGGSIVASLDRLATAANAIARGEFHRRVPVDGKDEFARLGLAFNEMADQLEARLEELGAERARLRDATVRFGDALAATHDVDQLLRVIVETVVETTGATGGLVVGLGGEIVQSGTLSDRGESFELPLTAGRQSFGTLTLSGHTFTVEQRRMAASL